MYAPLLSFLLAASVSVVEPAAVHPGQTGICVTEWTGGQRLEIPVEVMGTLDASAPGRSSVLIRLADPRFADAGIVAGMSGSPVYVDGKLLGAVAYGWAFAREPLAGVTPFTDMAQITPGPAPAPPAPPTLQQLAALLSPGTDPLRILPAPPRPAEGGPLLVSVGGVGTTGGFAERVLSRMGLHAVPAGGGSDATGVPEAGDMVAALLTWGDATLAAGGTVTAREGNRVYAFGHPFYALGRVRLPAARAHVVAVQTSYQNPFKVFTVGTPFGTFVADHPYGMLAEAGEPPAGLPLRVAVLHDGGSEASWSFHVARVPLLEPLLATYLVNASLTARDAAAGEATVVLDLTATLEDGRTSRVVQAMTGSDALARASSFAGAFLDFLDNSTFPHPAVSSLDVRLDRTERSLTTEIVEATPDRTLLRPGETIGISVRLRTEQENAVTKRLWVTVPADALPGRLDLIVADGAAWAAYAIKAAGIAPASFEDQLEQVAMLESSRTLVVAFESMEDGVALPGGSQPALPPSWAATLATGLGRNGVQRLKTAIVSTARWQSPYPLTGAFRIPMTVRPLQETP